MRDQVLVWGNIVALISCTLWFLCSGEIFYKRYAIRKNSLAFLNLGVFLIIKYIVRHNTERHNTTVWPQLSKDLNPPTDIHILLI